MVTLSARYMLTILLLCAVPLTAEISQAEPVAGVQESQQAPTGGMATGAAHPAEYDSEHRPVTAGGFVKSGPIIFENVAAKAGLTTWHHTAGTPEKRYIVEAKGPGVALLDYDNDGWLDIYFVNGSTYRCARMARQCRHTRLSSTTTTTARSPMLPHKAGVTNDRWGYGGRGSGLRQRWLAGHLRQQLRQEPALPQQPRRHLHRRRGKGRRGDRHVVDGCDIWRLRRRREAGSFRRRLSALRHRAPACGRNEDRWRQLLLVSRRRRSCVDPAVLRGR